MALSWWESSEDLLMGVFQLLIHWAGEPTAFEAYVSSNRARRGELFKFALDRYKHKFRDNEIEQLLGAINALNKLAQTRNEIAHGYCADASATQDGVQTMSGNYLVPSLHGDRWIERSAGYRYAHTAETIHKFIEDVRTQRGIVMDVSGRLTTRHNAQFNLGQETLMTISTAKRVAAGEIEPQHVLKHLALVDPMLRKHLDAQSSQSSSSGSPT
jgi:hypothetical protein